MEKKLQIMDFLLLRVEFLIKLQIVKWKLFRIQIPTLNFNLNLKIFSNLKIQLYIEKNYSGLKIDNQIRFILKEMLNLDPEKRLSPKQIVEYLSTKKEYIITQ